MSNILKFPILPGNKFYQAPVNPNPNPVKNKIPYLESVKMAKTNFTKKELKTLAQFNFFFDEQYQACYPTDDSSFDCELIEKRGTHFFYLEVLPFNLYPSTYLHFDTFQNLVQYLQSQKVA